MSGIDRSDEIRWRVARGERDELRAAGDRMQSESSRLLEWANGQDHHVADVPYEVAMAMLELRSAIEAWTSARSTNWPERVAGELLTSESPTDGAST